MALMNPVQLKDSSPAEARPTPNIMGTRLSITGRGVDSPRITLKEAQHRTAQAAWVCCVEVRVRAGRCT